MYGGKTAMGLAIETFLHNGRNIIRGASPANTDLNPRAGASARRCPIGGPAHYDRRTHTEAGAARKWVLEAH